MLCSSVLALLLAPSVYSCPPPRTPHPGRGLPEKPQQPALGSFSAPEASRLPEEPATGLSACEGEAQLPPRAWVFPLHLPCREWGCGGCSDPQLPSTATSTVAANSWGGGSGVPLPQPSGEGAGERDGPRASVSAPWACPGEGERGGAVTNLRATGSEGLLWDT